MLAIWVSQWNIYVKPSDIPLSLPLTPPPPPPLRSQGLFVLSETEVNL